MIKHERTNVKQEALIPGVIVGVVISVALCVLAAVLISWFVFTGILSEVEYQIPSMIGIGSSMLVGTIAASLKLKGKYAIVSMITACCYLLIFVMVNILFFDGSLKNILPVAVATAVGALVACLICLKIEKGNTRNKKGALVKLYKKSRR